MLLATISQHPVSALSGLNANGPLAQSFIIVTNESDQAIVAISAAWRIVDGSGTERRFRQKCDIFLPSALGKVVVGPKSVLYLGPKTCIAERVASGDLSPVISSFERKTFVGLGVISEIQITVDSVMFEKGDMFTTDSAYADEIVARVTAAKEAAAFVRAGMANGQGRNEVLTSLSQSVQSRLGEQGAWLRDFAAFLSHLPDRTFDPYLTSLGRVSTPAIKVWKQ
ncbi:MAG: hypothetical protein M3Y27_25665 [Acidobacteriota bacterium]|nr:hypothetical protein [Acidobacteriota bacterium]